MSGKVSDAGAEGPTCSMATTNQGQKKETSGQLLKAEEQERNPIHPAVHVDRQQLEDVAAAAEDPQKFPKCHPAGGEEDLPEPCLSGESGMKEDCGIDKPTKSDQDNPALAEFGLERAEGGDFFQIIDDCPPPPAPFPHRILTLKPGDVHGLFSINKRETLGGGKFGEVHTCIEKSTNLLLVVKMIKIHNPKDKEMALNEVHVMNQLKHRNLIQMYEALETPNEIYLFLEFLEGGELFERIIDENYQLTEMDAMVFVRQICEGVQYMHQMYVLHLDLKPENIVCVSQTSHMVKIIDFGFARRYKPREKLKVSFGTPEFLAPEVVNFDFVSFTTDMWSLGVISYVLLSGLSPFLGDNDTETLNNVLAAVTDFDEEPFENVSEEAKDFIMNLLIKEKSGRMSAAQCLHHPWLNNFAEKAKRCNRLLKSQIELRKYMTRRRWKKNFIAVTAANRFKKISSCGSLTTLED
uniref:Myosin light chain kinase 2, skeletal/cardiac muscle isoform X2 n=1 Tax=Geotrypetes seraphini TaxID=260995 RepID=A0A6P8SUX1_GEOSA|nr:myosin light chain kinase 2, skeletal/cardiac muscle isoform X2 [Geotrypetes seraphini]